MAYQADFKVDFGDTPDKLIFTDLSEVGEVIVSRKIKLITTELVESEHTFEPDSSTLIVTGLSKDLALHTEFIATPALAVVGSVYSKSKEFATTGYLSKKMSLRFIDLQVNKNIEDKSAHIKTSMEVEYYIKSAISRVKFCDLVGAQELLDYANQIAS